jgi:hypothetical protein
MREFGRSNICHFARRTPYQSPRGKSPHNRLGRAFLSEPIAHIMARLVLGLKCSPREKSPEWKDRPSWRFLNKRSFRI